MFCSSFFVSSTQLYVASKDNLSRWSAQYRPTRREELLNYSHNRWNWTGLFLWRIFVQFIQKWSRLVQNSTHLSRGQESVSYTDKTGIAPHCRTYLCQMRLFWSQYALNIAWQMRRATCATNNRWNAKILKTKYYSSQVKTVFLLLTAVQLYWL